MKKAMIDTRDNTVAQVEMNEFLVGDPYVWVDCPDDVVAYQWTYDGATFSPPPPPPEPPIPSTVNMYQARIALQQAGLLATVQAGVSQMSEEAQIKWEFAPTVKRNDALTVELAAALNLTEEQLDGLFTTAAGIV
jgi:hypothetical protein